MEKDPAEDITSDDEFKLCLLFLKLINWRIEMEKDKLIIIILVAVCLILGTALATYMLVANQHADASPANATNVTNNTTVQTQKTNDEPQKQVYAYKSDGTPMYSKEEVDNYVHSKYGDVNYHIQDNGYINIDDPGYTDDGAQVVKGGVRKNGKTYERSYYENYIMGKWA